MKNFINLTDIDKEDLRKIIDHAKSQKEKRSNLKKSAIDPNTPLADKTLIMIFEKTSTRTIGRTTISTKFKRKSLWKW